MGKGTSRQFEGSWVSPNPRHLIAARSCFWILRSRCHRENRDHGISPFARDAVHPLLPPFPERAFAIRITGNQLDQRNNVNAVGQGVATIARIDHEQVDPASDPPKRSASRASRQAHPCVCTPRRCGVQLEQQQVEFGSLLCGPVIRFVRRSALRTSSTA